MASLEEVEGSDCQTTDCMAFKGYESFGKFVAANRKYKTPRFSSTIDRQARNKVLEEISAAAKREWKAIGEGLYVNDDREWRTIESDFREEVAEFETYQFRTSAHRESAWSGKCEAWTELWNDRLQSRMAVKSKRDAKRQEKLEKERQEGLEQRRREHEESMAVNMENEEWHIRDRLMAGQEVWKRLFAEQQERWGRELAARNH